MNEAPEGLFNNVTHKGEFARRLWPGGCNGGQRRTKSRGRVARDKRQEVGRHEEEVMCTEYVCTA